MTTRFWRAALVGLLIMGVGIWGWWGWRQAAAAPTNAAGGASPILFVQNVGQFPSAVRFRADAGNHTLWFTHDAIYVDARRFPLAATHITPFAPRDTVVSYYQGGRQFVNVPVWGGLRFAGVQPGLDLEMSGAGGQLRRQWLRRGQPVTLAAAQDPLAAWPLATAVTHAPADWPFSFSSYLGGIYADEGDGIGVDSDGNVYVGGTTTSQPFPGVGPAAPDHGVDVYVAKFLPDGSDLDYVIHFNPPSSAPDYGYGFTVDDMGNAYLAGSTDSPDFPVTPGAHDTTYGGGSDGFLIKVDASGQVVYATFLGGTDFDLANGVAVDANGRAYVVGSTWSSDFITNIIGPADNRSPFVARISADGSSLERGFVVGGSGIDEATAVAVDDSGFVYFSGWTNSQDMPTTAGSFSPTPFGGWDVYVFELNLNAGTVVYGTYLGGSDEDRGAGLALNAGGNVFVTGMTRSSDFPTSAGAYDRTFGGGDCGLPCPDAFVARL
ncbi:MAG: SBBP repeat-containing protein, partial [Anaerolineales bacterium]|nr:SBBP repeat-containing protein [Anaerolineales bacterium]